MNKRRVLIGTPSYDGRLDVWYVNSLIRTMALANETLEFHHVFMSYDALVQRARNDIISIAVQGEFDDLIFIDSDMEWNPEWILSLLNRSEQVVGGTARKKNDHEVYVVKTRNLHQEQSGLIQVDGLGTGFVRIGRQALLAAWSASQEYQNEGKTCRLVCNVEVVDGHLHSEDTVLFSKLARLGFPAWLDPTMTCSHIGIKKYTGDFLAFMGRLTQKEDEK